MEEGEASATLASVRLHSTLVDQIKREQLDDPGYELMKQKVVMEGDVCMDDQGIIWNKQRLWVPKALRREVMKRAHESSYTMHPGATKMYQDLKSHYWWEGMKKDITDYVIKCLTCQQVKAEHQRPAGLHQSIHIPEWKWESITMDFVVGLPKTIKGYDSIWVIIDRLTKSAHFLPVKTTYTASQHAQLFLDRIIPLHGVPSTIISDRGTQFTSHFWKSFQETMGTQLRFSTAFHPQTDGQSERTIQTLEDMLRACTLEFEGSWDKYLPLIEFAYNNSYQASIQMAPFEALYGRKCRSPIGWFEPGEAKVIGPDLVEDAIQKVKTIREKLLAAQDRQKSYANMRRRELEFQKGERVFLKVSPMKGVVRFGKKGKLAPRYIGPFLIIKKVGKVAYQLDLPESMRTVHPVFHVSMLRKYVPDESHILKEEPVQLDQKLTYEERPVAIVDRQVRKLRSKEVPTVKVMWERHSEQEATWELEKDMQQRYPELFGKIDSLIT